jgi:CRP-like cAMP-binding protein
MGILSLYAEPFLMPATTQALVDSELLGINPDLVRQLADRDVRVAKALLLELTERATVLTAEIGGPAFSTVRQRVARHLDLAAQRQQGSELTAQVSGKNLRMPSAGNPTWRHRRSRAAEAARRGLPRIRTAEEHKSLTPPRSGRTVRACSIV